MKCNTHRGICRTIKHQFVTGLIVILPLFITFYVVWFLFKLIDNFLGQYFSHIFGTYVWGAGFVVLVLVIWFVGFMGTGAPGKAVIRYVRKVFSMAPMFGDLFKGVEEVSEFFAKEGKAFQQVVLFDYPHQGLYAMGFMTSGQWIKFKKAKQGVVVPVFMPTSPNPTSGFVIFVPKHTVYPLKMTVQQGMETIVSAGFVHPDEMKIK